MATEDNKKKKPDRSKRYRNLYDAYRDETGEDDNEFWSTLGAERDPGAASPETVKRSDPGAKTEQGEKIGRTVRANAGRRSAEGYREAESRSADSQSRAESRANKRKREQERKLRKGRRIFLVFLFLWAIVLIAGGVWLWRYTGRCLRDYEKSQPENNVERLLQEFVAKARDGSIGNELAVFTEDDSWKLQNEFENENYIKDQYLKKLADVKEYTCVKNKNSYSTTNPVYDILGDGETVAQMKLVSYNPRKILAILEVCDWKIASFSAVLGDVEYATNDYVYTVPTGYKVTVNGKELTEKYIVKTSEIPKELEYVKDYISIPVNVTYKVDKILNEPEVVITDPEGNVVNAAKDDKGCISIPYEVKTGGEAPADRYALALETAEKWMDFVTNDLTGKNRGLAEIRSYILKDSFFYAKSEEYAKGIDITFISAHTIEDPKLSDLAVTDYREYTDDCFSIHVYFVKNMRLIKGKKNKVTATLDSTIFFIYYDDTDDGVDNPHWTLADMIAGAKQNYGGEEEE